MKVSDSLFYNEALRFIGYGTNMGWHERNAGNVSLRLTDEEVESVRENFCFDREWIALPDSSEGMGGEFVFTTVSGSYFIDMFYESEKKFCICELSADGGAYRVVWGGENPTSELFSHLMSLSQLKKRNGGKAIYHAHPANIVAMSFILPQEAKAVSEAIWSCNTECAFVVPRGIGVVGFNVPGSVDLGVATARKIRYYDVVLWSHHGLFATGENVAEAFGLVHAVEKSAEIYLKILSTGREVTDTITKAQQIKTASAFGCVLNDFE